MVQLLNQFSTQTLGIALRKIGKRPAKAHPTDTVSKGAIMKIVKNQKGQGVMEYIILTSLIGIFCLIAVKQFGNVLQSRLENIKSQIVKEIPMKR